MTISISNTTQLLLPSSFTIFTFLNDCFLSKLGTSNITIFTGLSIFFLLPLYISVFYVGYQRQRQQKSGTTMNHSDLFTYSMIIVELINVLGSTFCFVAVHTDLPEMLMIGIYSVPINQTGQLLFHILTCVERYLAVVHPLTYLDLKKANGIRARNVAIGVVWLLCFMSVGHLSVTNALFWLISSFIIGNLAIITIAFCSISVLCALINPAPGDKKELRQRVSQSKLRAFHTMLVILGVLLLRAGGVMVTTALLQLKHNDKDTTCGLWMSVIWFCMPSSLVLPLLFLHRAGKLTCFQKTSKSGRGKSRV